jgi:predicted nucleic acid-binding protein
MIKHIVLDSFPLGAISHPKPIREAADITKWAVVCSKAGHKLYVPEVIDYELRRALVRAGKTKGLNKLDGLRNNFSYLPITTAAMRLAADLWALARAGGYSTGDPKKLDIDAILAAQTLTLGIPTSELVIATSNVSHLSRYAPADEWRNIKP